MVNDQHTSVVHEDKQREDDANLDKPHVHINLQDYQFQNKDLLQSSHFHKHQLLKIPLSLKGCY
jgi:hypothetical protein